MEYLQFLNSKPLFYDKIDLERMPKAFEMIKNHTGTPHIIHIVGTNGKGSTGRFLASALFGAGFRVTHYSSPHILKFNERIWIDGEDISEGRLEEGFRELIGLLDEQTAQALSYFEFSTLLMAVCAKECDYIVMEAGLGGEMDATAVFDRELSLFTPIDMDHKEFLGNSINKIASTKLRSMSNRAIIAPQPYNQTLFIAKNIAKKRAIDLYFLDDLLSKSDQNLLNKVSKKRDLPAYQRSNLSLAIAALKILNIEYDESSFGYEMFGRFTLIADNIYLDVGHNALAARVIRESLQGKRVTLIYNSFKDKEYKQMLSILRDVVDEVQIIDLLSDRAVEREELERVLDELGLRHRSYTSIDADKEYLVFGSFAVAEALLKRVS